jgi:pimeloyl-ACP methyl ester carboxylesterase
MAPFATKYRAIAYSRRYNFPNTNPAQAGYSAIVDADDLARFIRTLGLGKIVVIGHSYGALTALFLATRHPELVSAMVLAEPPVVSLLNHLSEQRSAEGHAMFQDIQTHMVAPMKEAFAKGDRNGGVATFMDYVFNDPAAWSKMSQSSRDETMRDAHEWDLVMTTGTLFPDLDPASIQRISAPVLMFSGGKSSGSRPLNTFATYILMRGKEDALSIVVQIDHQDLTSVVNFIFHATFASKYLESIGFASTDSNWVSESPIEERYAFRLGTTLRKSPLLTAWTPLGPPNMNVSA